MLFIVGSKAISDNNTHSFSSISKLLQYKELIPIEFSVKDETELLTEKYPDFPFSKVSLTQA